MKIGDQHGMKLCQMRFLQSCWLLQSLIDAMSGTGSVAVGAEIVVVISNKPGVEGLKRAERAGIPTEVRLAS